MNSYNKVDQLDENLLNSVVNASREEPIYDRVQEVVKTRKNCCWVFSLQTGVMMVFMTDVIVLLILLAVWGMATDNMQDRKDYDGSDSLAFNLLSDGICILLYLIRIFYGARYILAALFPEKMSYQYILDKERGNLKWHTKRVKKMRIHCKNYALASNVSLTFMMIQTIVLFLVLYQD